MKKININNIFNKDLILDKKNVKIEKIIKIRFMEKKENKNIEKNSYKQNFEL